MIKSKQNKVPFEMTNQILRIINQLIDKQEDFPSAKFFTVKQYNSPLEEPEISEDHATEKTEKNLKDFWDYLISIKAVKKVASVSNETFLSVSPGICNDVNVTSGTQNFNDILLGKTKMTTLISSKDDSLKAIKLLPKKMRAKFRRADALDFIGMILAYEGEKAVYKPIINKIKALLPKEKISHDSEMQKDNNTLKNKKVSFNEEFPEIKIGKTTIKLPPNKKEYLFCKAIFKHKKKEAIDWSTIWEDMTGEELTMKEPRNERYVLDAVNAINKRIKKELQTEYKVFLWQEKTISRQF